MYEKYKKHVRHKKSYYKNHSYNRANSRFDYSRKEVAEILSLIKKGKYVKHRVFFLNEETAILAGYRPCGVCLKEKYKIWKNKNLT